MPLNSRLSLGISTTIIFLYDMSCVNIILSLEYGDLKWTKKQLCCHFQFFNNNIIILRIIFKTNHNHNGILYLKWILLSMF